MNKSLPIISILGLKLLEKGNKIEDLHKSSNQLNQPIWGFKYINKHVYHWFGTYMYDGANGVMYLDHSYSQNTGVTKKGVTHKMKVERRVKSLIEKLSK